MKSYYSKLDKNEKENIKKKYMEEYKNSELDKRLKYLIVYHILALVFGIAIIVQSIIMDDVKIYGIIIGCLLIFMGIVFLIANRKIKNSVLNKIALKNK